MAAHGGSDWIGAVVSVAVIFVPLAFPTLSRTARKFLKPRRCPRCLGVGNNLCGRCKGRGKEGGVFTGLPLEKCKRCGGRGRQRCKPCASTGLANHWLYTPVADGGWGPRGSE
ncbi:hypothetical protein R1flu_000409 [Riccia fluitans]|uniref:Uncharacterized protein n=1 Tax=Riccia fluitans TaxID=41844 RepID=A0ABD1Y0D1_9MARC